MGAIDGEELRKLEKMQVANTREEKILVLVRLRPLSEREITANEVADWECINDTTILYRNTLREGSLFPSTYSFDRVFRGDCSTKQVYEEGAKAIALSVVNGINSSIFAYGQTSSGKTYTMTGITEYTVADIFDYIHRHEERAFGLKFSAIEIYNEAIRDLLSSDDTSLRLRDDPEKGTIVEKMTEETLKDWNHLKELLSICEAQRRIGETSLNERSSRSHQIIKLTIESSAREFLGKENSTTLVASVNFIDLAGSERASQALSAGTRLKEGCHINRSLLTLGTVIRKLSTGRNGHINYRDSKLTRILQPCLGGNARTAIVCTLSPARSHVEQTRNTLLFACCAKEVGTKAQVNVVMSDKALVKHLQKELARLESELRSPVPASSTCDYPALLRRKDLQIQKMEKEIRELTKQRDLAQSRVEDLLKMVGHDQSLKEWHPNPKGDTWEDECLSELSAMVDSRHLSMGGKNFKRTYCDTESGSNCEDSCYKLQENHEDYMSDGTSSALSVGKKLVKSDLVENLEERAAETSEDPDEYCKEVQCIEMEESRRDNNVESSLLSDGQGEGMLVMMPYGDVEGAVGQETTSSPVNREREASQQNGFTYGALEQSLHHVQKTIDSLLSPDKSSPHEFGPDMSNSRSLKLTRSISCRANLMTDSGTPPNGLEKNFPGRPESVRRKFSPFAYGVDVGKLSRNNSQSSLGSASTGIKTSADEDITSIHTFVAGLKEMAKHHGQTLESGQRANRSEKSVKDVGLDAMTEAFESHANWPLDFERQRQAILELWQTCNVSLVHRTYFFLLFKGDPTDSIYMEVEIRRLSFLKENFSRGNQAVEHGRTLTLSSSLRALQRERLMLSKLLSKRFSEGERRKLYEKWGIGLNSKRRRLRLTNLLWNSTKDINHITESAAIVAKLIRFVEPGEALKEMFGLSFTPPCSRRRSFGWKNSMASLF